MKKMSAALIILVLMLPGYSCASVNVLAGGWWDASIEELLSAREQIDAQIIALEGSLPTPIFMVTPTPIVKYVYISPSPTQTPYPTATPTPSIEYEHATMALSAGLRIEPKTSLGAMRTIQTGEIVTILESCEEDQQFWYKIRCTDGAVGYVLQRTVASENTIDGSPAATHVPKAVASTPTPVELKLRIESVKIKQNSIGVPELYARFTNTGSSSIDRFDFLVECYDRYGEVIKGHGIYNYSSCYFEGSILSPNATSSKDYYWTLYGCNGTVSVKIAITKYHTTNGQTVEIPEDQYRWKKF